MILNHGVADVHIPVSDLDMTSVKPDRIVLKYNGKIWDELMYEIIETVINKDRISDPYSKSVSEMISSLNVYIGFDLSAKIIIPYVYIHIVTPNLSIIEEDFVLNGHFGECLYILDEFFKQGCKGLSTEFQTIYKIAYSLCL